MSIRLFKGRSGVTNCCVTVAGRSARSTCPAISSASKTARSIGSRPKPSSTPPFAFVKRHSLEREAKNDPAMVLNLLKMMTDNLQHAENHLLLLGRQSARERVGVFLLEMNGRLRSRGAIVIALPMTRRDIADYLGLTHESVTRALSAYQRQGYLKLAGPHLREISVLNSAALAEVHGATCLELLSSRRQHKSECSEM